MQLSLAATRADPFASDGGGGGSPGAPMRQLAAAVRSIMVVWVRLASCAAGQQKKQHTSLPVFCSPCLIVLRAPAGTGMYCTRYVLFLFFTSTKLYSNPIDASPISCCWYLVPVPGTLASCWELYRISLPLGIREPIWSMVLYRRAWMSTNSRSYDAVRWGFRAMLLPGTL